MTWTDGEYHPKQQRADEKKARLLQAALELFGSQGFHRTTSKAIAAHADVATGSFYRYFKDKKALLMALCQQMEEELGGRMLQLGRELREQGQSEQQILAQMIHFAVTGHRHHPDFHREMLALQRQDPDVAQWTEQREARVRGALHQFLREGQGHYRVTDLEAAVELVFASVEAIAHRAILDESPVGEDRLIGSLQEMLQRYLFNDNV